MGNQQQSGAVGSGDRPNVQVGDVVRALHPGLQCFCRARVIEVRRYKIANLQPRWIVKVRWAEYWMDEPDATSVVEPSIMALSSIPNNRHLSFTQIVCNPFPYYPQFSEVFYQPEGVVARGSSAEGGVHTWSPGFVVEENEHQYRIEYINKDWKPHPLLANEENDDPTGADSGAAGGAGSSLASKIQSEKTRVKMAYKDALIQAKLKKDAKKLAARRKIQQAEIDAARAEVLAAQKRLKPFLKARRARLALAAQNGEDPAEAEDEEDGDEKHDTDAAELDLVRAKDKLKLAIEAYNKREEDDEDAGDAGGGADDDDEDDDPESVAHRPSISHRPDTSLIYRIDYANLDPTFAYDPDLVQREGDHIIEEEPGAENGGAGADGSGGGGYDDFGADPKMSEQELLELEMAKELVDTATHPSQWLTEDGEEKFASPGNGGAPVPIARAKSKSQMKKKKKDKAAGGGAKVGFENENGFYDDEAPAEPSTGEDDDAAEDEEEEEEPPHPADDPEHAQRMAALLGLRPGGLSAGDTVIRTLEDQQSIDEWTVSHPRFMTEWVNKYSTRLKRQTLFFNGLYSKFLQGIYEESLEDKLFRIQQKREELLELEKTKPKKWYQPKRNLAADAEKEAARVEAEVMASEANHIHRDDTFDEDDQGLDIFRRERYESVVEQGNKWFVEEPLQIDGDHIAEMTYAQGSEGAAADAAKGAGAGAASSSAASASSSSGSGGAGGTLMIPVAKHKRKIHPLDLDDPWDSFMLDAWVRYRYEYRDPLHPDFARGLKKGAAGAKSFAAAPKKQKWIWAMVKGKDHDEMVLQLLVPEALRKHAWANASNNRKSVSTTSLLNASAKRGSQSVSLGSSNANNLVVLSRSDESTNARLIKYWHDRIRRWNMDSTRRFQIELAAQGLFLCFINRIAVEANEDPEETERELNSLMVQAAVRDKEMQQERMLAAAGRPSFGGAAAGSAGPAGGGGDAVASGRVSRFNNRRISNTPDGTPSGPASRSSIFAALDGAAPALSTMTLENTGMGQGLDGLLSSQKSFASPHLNASIGYGVYGYDDMLEDGNSLYRAVSLQLYGTAENYNYIKTVCLQHIAAHQSYFSLFLDVNFEYYLALKFRSMDPRNEVTAYGDHLDLQAICEVYDVAVHIYSQAEMGANSMASGNAKAQAKAHAAQHQHQHDEEQMLSAGGMDYDPPSSASSASSAASSAASGNGGLLQNQPFIRFYDDVNPDGTKLPTICLSYAGYGHYDAVKRHTTIWPLRTALDFPVHTRTRIANVVLRARQRTEFEAVERVRVEESRRAYELIATASANAPLGRSRASKQAQKHRRLARLQRAQDRANQASQKSGAFSSRHGAAVESSSSEEEDNTLDSVILSMTSRHARQLKPVDTQRMEVLRTILVPRELQLCTYVGEVLFSGDVGAQTAQFLDCLASAHIEYGAKKLLLSSGYNVQQLHSRFFWHDMHIQSMEELVSKQNLEGLAAVAMYGQEDGAGGATTTTGEGLKLNLPRVVVIYPYHTHDAHMDEDEREAVAERLKGRTNQSGHAPLMHIEGVQLAVEEMVRLVRRVARMEKLRKISQATWLPPS